MITDATANSMLDSQTLDLMSLHTAYSATGTNEVTGGTPAYAKKSVTFAAASGRARAASTAPVFDVPTGTTVRWVGIWTAAGTVFKGMAPNGGSEFDYQVDVTNNRILAEGHTLANGNNVVFFGGTPPTGLTEGTVYFVVGVTASDPDYFQVSLTSGGAAIDITGIGSGQCKASRLVEEVYASQGTHTVNSYTLGLTE